VLERVPARTLRAYFVWLPILPRDDFAAAVAQATRIPDPRVTHFWDGDRALGWRLGELLALPPRDPGHSHGVAWDVYLAYARRAGWPTGRAPPAPTFWMHQLWGANKLAPRLDGATLRGRIERLLAK